MLHQSEGLFQRLPVLPIHRSALWPRNAGCLQQVFVAIGERTIFRPFADEQVHAHSVASHLVLRNDERAGPVIVEGRLLPFGVGLEVHVARAVCSVDEEEERLLPQVLVAHEVNESLVAWFPVAFVGTEVVVCISPPDEIDVRCPIPVLGGQRNSWAIMEFQ